MLGAVAKKVYRLDWLSSLRNVGPVSASYYRFLECECVYHMYVHKLYPTT